MNKMILTYVYRNERKKKAEKGEDVVVRKKEMADVC